MENPYLPTADPASAPETITPAVSAASTLATPVIPPAVQNATAAKNNNACIAPAEHKKKQPRTWGLWAVDTLLYPIVNNLGVFTMSVAATYLTAKGDKINTGYKFIDGIGKMLKRRGDWMERQFGKFMSANNAEMSKIVAFSFIDGCALAPFVKIGEDHREDMARWVDKKLGTEPKDPSVYQAEPKQTWASVLGGRAATCLVVVPTAVLLSRPYWKNAAGSMESLNDRWFNNPGKKLGKAIENSSWTPKWLRKLDIPELTRLSIFEGVYTSICTAGLFVNSRLIATFTGKKTPDNAVAAGNNAAAPPAGAGITHEQPATAIPAQQHDKDGKATLEKFKRRPFAQPADSFRNRHELATAHSTLSLGI